MNKKKICLVIPSLHPGGMERVMSELAEYFSKKNEIETHLIILSKTEKFYPIPELAKLYEPDFIFNPKCRFYHTLKTLFFLRGQVKKIKPDVLLSFGEMYNTFVLLATLFLKTKIFISDRSRPDKKWGSLHGLLRKIFYRKAAGIISQTTQSKKFLSMEVGHKHIAVIPNPIKPWQPGVFKKQNVVLTVGRLIFTKRIDLLIDVFSHVKQEGWQLWIVGDGPQRASLEKLAQELPGIPRVKFWGNQKNMDRFYAEAEIFAFTSVSEGFPNALLEATAAGLPCVVFDCMAGPSDLIVDGVNGFLVPELDAGTFKNRLETLMKDGGLRMKFSENARAGASKYYIEKVGADYLEFILS